MEGTTYARNHMVAGVLLGTEYSPKLAQGRRWGQGLTSEVRVATTQGTGPRCQPRIYGDHGHLVAGRPMSDGEDERAGQLGMELELGLR